VASAYGWVTILLYCLWLNEHIHYILTTPFEALYDSKPTINNLRIFRCKDFAHIPKENRKKLDTKAIKCIFIGYRSEFKSYKLFDPSTHKVFASRDVIFHEHAKGNNEDNSHEGWHALLKDEDVKEEKHQ
jgi:hypothetical protein